MKTDSRLSAYCHETRIFQMYGSDAGQPVPSLYIKGLSPLCDTGTMVLSLLMQANASSALAKIILHVFMICELKNNR